MNWSHALVAEHRHADLTAEAATWRLAGGNRQVAGGTEQAARDRTRRLPIPWRTALAR
jgi:hypothetical protein